MAIAEGMKYMGKEGEVLWQAHIREKHEGKEVSKMHGSIEITEFSSQWLVTSWERYSKR